MIYYFDTNILVTAQRLDFPLVTAPDFWAWLVEQGEAGIVKLPESVVEEIGKGDDPLSVWVGENKGVFQAPTVEALPSMPTVLNAYETPMQAGTLEKIQVDACVIAHAHACTEQATVVSYEQPKTRLKARIKRFLPSATRLRWLASGFLNSFG